MRTLLISLFALCASPALADWTYVPPPVDAVVIYDDGHSARIDAISGERITVISKTKGKSERLVYRTWLVRERFLAGKKGDELFLDTGASDSIVHLWPLHPGESMTHSFRTERDGKLLSTGMQTMTYVGEEFIELPAGTFHAHRLERRYVLTKASDGQQYRGTQTTWHDTVTGLVLRVDWEVQDADGTDEGSYVATAVELP
jgi:hypothetical protein